MKSILLILKSSKIQIQTESGDVFGGIQIVKPSLFKPTLLGNVLKFFNGKSIKPGGDGEYPVYGSNGLIGRSYEYTHQNGLIIGRVGAYCGAIKHCKTHFWASDNTIVVQPKDISFDIEYIYYLLVGLNLNRYAGGSAQPLLTQTVIRQVPTSIPPLPTQTQIANFLGRKTEQIDELIRIKERQIELLQEQRTALINQIVTKGLAPNVEMKPSGVEWIGEIPAHWTIEKIKHAATLVSEKSTPETEAIKISPENVESETGKVLDFYSSYDAVGVKFQDGDVLFNKIRVYLNKVVFAKYDGYSLGEMIVIRPTLQCMGKYLFYLMLSNRFIRYCDSISYGAKMPRTAIGDILNAKIPIPLDQEKLRIASFLDRKTQQIDELIATEQRKIELLKEYRQSLISEAVTGKIDVRNKV